MGCWRCSSSSRSRSREISAQGLKRYEPSESDKSSCEDGSGGEPDSSEDDDSSEDEDRSFGHADMSVPNLAALKTSGSGPELEQHNVYAKNGMKASRIRTVLSGKKGSGCDCERQCLDML